MTATAKPAPKLDTARAARVITTAARTADADADGLLTLGQLAAVIGVKPATLRRKLRVLGHGAGQGSTYMVPVEDVAKLVRKLAR